MRNNITDKPGSQTFGRVLILSQLVASISLIVGTLTVQDQLKYMSNFDLGINIDQTLVIKTVRQPNQDSTYSDRINYLTNNLLNYPFVTSISNPSYVPGQDMIWTRSIKNVEDQTNNFNTFYMNAVDYDYLTSFDLKLLAGRDFSKDIPTDFESVIVNESASRLLGFINPQTALNNKIIRTAPGEARPLVIIGVIKDYHQKSVKSEIDPIILMFKG